MKACIHAPILETLSAWRVQATAIVVAILAIPMSSCSSAPPPDHLNLFRARNALFFGRYDWAHHFLIEDLQQNPNRPESLRDLGQCWVDGETGSIDQAVDAFDKYLRIRPWDEDIVARQVSLLREMGRTAEASALTHSLKEGSRRAFLLAQQESETNPEVALAHALRAAELDPHSFYANWLAAQLSFQLNRYQETIQFCENASRLEPFNRQIFLLKARAHEELSDTAAVRQTQAIIAIIEKLSAMDAPNGENPPPMDPLQAIDLIQSNPETWPPENPQIRKKVCFLTIASGNIEEGRRLFDRLMFTRDWGTGNLIEMAEFAKKQGQIDLTRKAFQRIRENNWSDRRAILGLTEIAEQQGRPEFSTDYLERAVEMEPFFAPYQARLGATLAKRGKTDQAIDCYRGALNLAPWQSDYRIALAELYWHSRQLEEYAKLHEAPYSEDSQWIHYLQESAVR